MTLSVYRLPSRQSTVSHSSLVCHLRSITVEDAITRLAKAGVLAIEGPEKSSIILVGFTSPIVTLLHDWRRYGFPRAPEARYALGKLRKLAS